MSERVQHDTELGQAEMARLERLDWVEETITPESLKQAFATRSQVLYSEISRFEGRNDPLTKDMIESLLLLIWRHALFYANNTQGESLRPYNLSVSLGSTGDGRSVVGQMRPLRNMAAELRGILQRLGDVKEVSLARRWGYSCQPEELRRTGEQSLAYFGMLLRRLGELTAGLCGDET